MLKDSNVICDCCGKLLEEGITYNSYVKIFGKDLNYCEKCASKNIVLEENEILCPDCKGTKITIGIFPVWANIVPKNRRKSYTFLPCLRCARKGKVSKEMIKWQREGEKLKDFRLNKRITLRGASKRLGIEAERLSNMERGVIQPNISVYNFL
jgi:hypothetical protein